MADLRKKAFFSQLVQPIGLKFCTCVVLKFSLILGPAPLAGHPTPYTPSVEELLHRLRSWTFGNDLYTVRA